MASGKDFNLVFRGEVALDHDPLATQQKLAQALKAPAEKIPLLFSGKPFVVKRGVSFEDGLKLQRQILQIGAITYVEASTHNINPSITHPSSPPPNLRAQANTQKLNLSLAPIEPPHSIENLNNSDPADSDSATVAKQSFRFPQLNVSFSIFFAVVISLIGLSFLMIFSPYPDLVIRKGFLVGGIILFFGVRKLKR